MKQVIRVLLKAVKVYLIIAGILFTGLLIYYAPVIDRLFIRPCHYYPNTFIDCQVKE